MSTKSSRLVDIEWWIVPKRLIYIIVALIVFSLGAGGAVVYLWTHGNPFKSIERDAPALAGARFDSFEGEVRVMRAQTRETVQARSDTQLYAGDTVQTGADARARISFADGSTFVVRPNSVITIRDNDSAGNGERTNVRVAVARGQVNVRTEQQTEGTSNVVETKLTENRVAAQTASSFGVRDDNTEDIRVQTGSIETSTHGGDKTTVRGGEYISISQSGTIKSREKLLDGPFPSAPRNLERIAAREAGGATSVALRWQRPASGVPAYYRVEVATSPFFVAAGKVIERDQLEAVELSANDLRPGNYFWRVRAVAASGQTSEWSEPQKFIIVAGGNGERLVVSDVSFEYVAGNIYLVRGRSQPGNTVRIAGRETLAVGNGAFQLQITIPKETRELTVEAEDAPGNRGTYRIPFSPDAAQR